MPRGRHPEDVSPYTGLRVPACKGTYTQKRGGVDATKIHNGNSTLRQFYTQKLPTSGGEWPTFHTARAQRTVRPLNNPQSNKLSSIKAKQWHFSSETYCPLLRKMYGDQNFCVPG